MSRIIQLSDLIANQIAAGEVVERPASVVKELVENSIDAKATHIEIELSGVGANRICIRDNGDGIVKEDLALAFARHATSKIRTSEDLFGIQSLGFRGEALASMASIARCKLKSKAKDEEAGWEIQASPEGISEIKPSSSLPGTTIEICDLFYNTPVRRKFLKSEKTESLAIEDLVKKFVLANPEIEFSLKQDDRSARTFPRCKHNALNWLGKVTGQAFADAAIAIDVQGIGLALRGWIAKPSFARRQGDLQYFFVNNRIIKDRAINHAIKSILVEQPDWVSGSYPAYVLYLTLPPQEVDVNVHPTKQEVRFTQSRLVHDFVASVIRKALSPAQNPKTTRQNRLPSRRFKPEHDFSLPIQLAATKENLSRERYFLYEQDQHVMIVDLLLVQKYLITAYFRNNTSIPTKTLLFPQTLLIQSDTNLIAILTLLGFKWLVSQNEMRLIQQPQIMAQPLTATDWSAVFLATSKLEVIDSLAAKMTPDFSRLNKQELIKLIQDVPSSLVCKISYENMQKLFESKVIEF